MSKFLSSEPHLHGLQLHVLPSRLVFCLSAVCLPVSPQQPQVAHGPRDTADATSFALRSLSRPSFNRASLQPLFANSQAFLSSSHLSQCPEQARPFLYMHHTALNLHVTHGLGGCAASLEGRGCPITESLSGWHRPGVQQTSAGGKKTLVLEK